MITIRLDADAWIDTDDHDLLAKVKTALEIKNPARAAAKKAGRYFLHLPERLLFWSADGRACLRIPRGFYPEALAMLAGRPYQLQDNRLMLEPLRLEFAGQLRDYQQAALDAALDADDAVLEMPTGAGKTITALSIIAARRAPALILVHTKELADQWAAAAAQWLTLNGRPLTLGRLGAGKNRLEPVTVAMVLSAKKHLPRLADRFTHIIVDECHRTPSSTFQAVVSALPGKYRLGLSATPYRNDGLDRLINFTLGPVAGCITQAEMVDAGAILEPEIRIENTAYHYPYADDYQRMIADLSADPGRNRQIAHDIRATAQAGRLPLCIADRVDHLHALHALVGLGDASPVLTGRLNQNDRETIVDALHAGDLQAIFATGQLVGEGFDAPGLTDLFLAGPIKYAGKLTQAVGRILRPAPGKGRPRIWDYSDPKQGVLLAQAKKRHAVYERLNRQFTAPDYRWRKNDSNDWEAYADDEELPEYDPYLHEY